MVLIPKFMAFHSRIYGIFGKYHRIIISKGNAFELQSMGGLGNVLRACFFGKPVKFFGFADVPILAEFTS